MDSLLKRMLAVEQEAADSLKAAEGTAATTLSQAKEEARVRLDQARGALAAAVKAQLQGHVAAAETERHEALARADRALADLERRWQERLPAALPAAVRLFSGAPAPEPPPPPENGRA